MLGLGSANKLFVTMHYSPNVHIISHYSFIWMKGTMIVTVFNYQPDQLSSLNTVVSTWTLTWPLWAWKAYPILHTRLYIKMIKKSISICFILYSKNAFWNLTRSTFNVYRKWISLMDSVQFFWSNITYEIVVATFAKRVARCFSPKDTEPLVLRRSLCFGGNSVLQVDF